MKKKDVKTEEIQASTTEVAAVQEKDMAEEMLQAEIAGVAEGSVAGEEVDPVVECGEVKQKPAAKRKTCGVPDEKEMAKMAERQARLDIGFGDYPESMRFLGSEGSGMSMDRAELLQTLAEGYGRGREMSDADIDRAMVMMMRIGKAYTAGRYTAEMVGAVMKGLAYDHDIAVVSGEAEIRGRNAQIEERMKSVSDSDGVPYLGSGGSLRKRSRGIFSLAESAR